MIRLVCGPPGAGKSTLIRERKKPGDLVIDYDDIRASVVSDDLARRFRALLEDSAHKHEGGDVWIARTLPDPADRESFVERVGVEETLLLDTPADVAKERVLARDGDDSRFPAIDRWWGFHSPDMGGSDKEESLGNTVGKTDAVGAVQDEVAQGDLRDGYPADTPLVEMTVEQREAYWKTHSRKHEKTAKELAEKVSSLEEDAKAWRSYQASKDDPVVAARREAQREIFDARLEAAAARAGVEISSIVKHLNVDSFADDDGRVDTEKINDFVSGLPSGNPPKPRALPDDAGSNDPVPAASGLAVGSELYGSLHGK